MVLHVLDCVAFVGFLHLLDCCCCCCWICCGSCASSGGVCGIVGFVGLQTREPQFVNLVCLDKSELVSCRFHTGFVEVLHLLIVMH